MTAQTLRELVEKATPAPWIINKGNITTVPTHKVWGKSYAEQGVVHVLVATQPSTDNAKLIAYLRNHASDFIKLIEAAENMRDCSYTLSPQNERLAEALAAFKEE